MVVGKRKNKRTRRGGRRGSKYNCTVKVNPSDDWSLYHINIRNLDSRRASLESMLSVKKFSVVTLNETHFHAGRKVTLSGYTSFSRNRIDKASGGI